MVSRLLGPALARGSEQTPEFLRSFASTVHGTAGLFDINRRLVLASAGKSGPEEVDPEDFALIYGAASAFRDTRPLFSDPLAPVSFEGSFVLGGKYKVILRLLDKDILLFFKIDLSALQNVILVQLKVQALIDALRRSP